MSTRPRSRRPRRLRRRLLALGALGVAFVAGIGLGQALHDRPDVAGTQVIVRTLQPLPLTPVASETVTVTTSNR